MRIYMLILFITGSGFAFSDYPDSAEMAIRTAEKFIVSEGYSIKRKCPNRLQKLDDQGSYDMQRHCKDYDASEAKAFAILNADIFWRLYFRKNPSEVVYGHESFRIVQISLEHGTKLHDIELTIDKEATIIGN